MEQPPQRLRSLLIPFQCGYALLPNSAVAEVVPFATPLLMEKAPSWVIGKVFWRAAIIPVVSLEGLAFDLHPKLGAHSRIIVVNALSGDPQLRCFGFLATAVPRLINLGRAEIALDETAKPAMPGVLSQVRVDGQAAIIPDLDAIEAELLRLSRSS